MKTEEIIKKDLEISTFNAGNPLVTTKIEDVYSLWIYGVKLNSKPNTIVKYEGIFRNHISDIKNIPIAEINRVTVNVFTKKLQSKGLSNKTINDILIVLNMLLNYAAEEYEINIPKIKYLREPRNKTRYLTVAEEKRLIDYLMTNTDVHKFGTLLALFTGKPVPRAFPLSKAGCGEAWPPAPPAAGSSPSSSLLAAPLLSSLSQGDSLGLWVHDGAGLQPMALNSSCAGETKKLPSVGNMGLAAGNGPNKWTFLL